METSQHSRKIALFDVCNTLVDHDTLGDFTERYLLSRSRNPEFKLSTWLYHFIWRFLRGRTNLLKSHSGRTHDIYLLKGFTQIQLEPLSTRYAEHLRTSLKGVVLQRLEQLKREGYDLFLVSAGLDVYLRQFARSLGATPLCTNLAVDESGVYTGAVEGVDCIGEGKVQKISEQISLDGYDRSNSYAFGDSFSDVPMLSLVGHAVVVDPSADLASLAHERGWEILNTR